MFLPSCLAVHILCTHHRSTVASPSCCILCFVIFILVFYSLTINDTRPHRPHAIFASIITSLTASSCYFLVFPFSCLIAHPRHTVYVFLCIHHHFIVCTIMSTSWCSFSSLVTNTHLILHHHTMSWCFFPLPSPLQVSLCIHHRFPACIVASPCCLLVFFFSRLHQQSIGLVPTSHASVTIITSLSGLDHDIFLVFLFFPSRHQHSPRCCITMLSLGVSFPWPTLSLPHHLQSILCIHRLVHITGSLHFVLSPWCFFFLESITPPPLYYALHPFD